MEVIHILLAQIPADFEWTKLIQTFGSVLIPVLAVLWKLHNAKQQLEMSAAINTSHHNLIKHSDNNKKEVLEKVDEITVKLNENIIRDEARDTELKRLNGEIEKLQNGK